MKTQDAFESLLAAARNSLAETDATPDPLNAENSNRREIIQTILKDLQWIRKSWKEVIPEPTRNLKLPFPPPRKPQRRGGITSGFHFQLPILQALNELEGSAPAADVLTRVEELLRSRLTTKDYQKTPSGKEIRWKTTARWTRQILVTKGWLAHGSPRGTWSITPAGKAVLVAAREEENA